MSLKCQNKECTNYKNGKCILKEKDKLGLNDIGGCLDIEYKDQT